VLDVYPLEEMVEAEKYIKETPFTPNNIQELRRHTAICRRVRRAFVDEKDGKIPKNCSSTILNRFPSLKIPEVVSLIHFSLHLSVWSIYLIFNVFHIPYFSGSRRVPVSHKRATFSVR